jgi:hypothetical protein
VCDVHNHRKFVLNTYPCPTNNKYKTFSAFKIKALFAPTFKLYICFWKPAAKQKTESFTEGYYHCSLQYVCMNNYKTEGI